MPGKKPNYKMLTIEKLNKIGITKDKQLIDMNIEDIPKIPNLKIIDIQNIIDLRASIRALKSKDESGILGFLSKINNDKGGG